MNAVAAHCEAQLDLRSGGNDELLKLEKTVLACFDEALEEENRRANAEGDMKLKLTKKQIGSRPAGVADDLSPVILAARAAPGNSGHSSDPLCQRVNRSQCPAVAWHSVNHAWRGGRGRE